MNISSISIYFHSMKPQCIQTKVKHKVLFKKSIMVIFAILVVENGIDNDFGTNYIYT